MWLHHEIKTLADIPRHYGRTLPNKHALIGTGGDPVTFAELDAKSNRIANAMIKLGVEPGDNVAFLGKNSSRFFEILFGAHKAGAALVPLNWRLASPELSAVVEDASPTLIIVDREYEEAGEVIRKSSKRDCPKLVFDSSQPGTTDFDELMKTAPATDPAIPLDPRQTALLVYTSGTTGRPKGVQQSHQGHLYTRLCEHLDPAIKYQDDDKMLTVMPIFHAMGAGLSLQALYNGATVIIHSMPDPGELMKMIARERPTIVPLVPTVIQMMLDHPTAPDADYSSIRILLYAGASISFDLLKRALGVMKCDFFNDTATTETTVEVTFLRRELHLPGCDEKKLKSCGTPLPLMEIKVVDADGNEVPDGQVGEFLIRSPALSTGYYNQPELTAATFKDGWYRSGDGGYRDSDGFLYIIERIKDMIISGGENVYSVEVEQAIMKHPGVELCAVVGLPDEKWGERVVATIVPKESVNLTAEEVVAHCRRLIAGYKVPKQIEFVKNLPMTASGKLMKGALRSQLSPRASTVSK